MVHITGGGFFENIPRMFPAGLQANVELALAHPTLGAEFKRYLDARYGVA